MTATHETWMDLCLDMARQNEPTGNTPVASVVVRDGEVLGRGVNEVTTRQDPMLHAETAAIGDACRKLGTNKLTGAVIYSTMEPCPMCAWAIRTTGITQVVLGARFKDLGRTDLGDYTIDGLMRTAKVEMTITNGVRVLECVALRRDWMDKTGRVI